MEKALLLLLTICLVHTVFGQLVYGGDVVDTTGLRDIGHIYNGGAVKNMPYQLPALEALKTGNRFPSTPTLTLIG